MVGDRLICYGMTTDLERRELEHRRRWPNGRVEQIDEPTTHREAWEWQKAISNSSAQSRED